ncbi:MAG TPA: YqiJ family protein [Noviherbaspirillum sp.]|jgi:membrane protein implicated in regulation of membrane protease activity|uniref:YqiJ family protein n=1 Tax=Noviherbaspirillum sp. TaxID=1926288 RepID=UPI002DDC92B2|nr:YqiJ family protein [Noviherbaspirillum sp.]HEV2611199.1 YqiJ family protein [Noviherbaspirillum sp.]
MMLFAASETLPFSVAACVMIGLAVIEGIGIFTAISPSQFLDNFVAHSPDGIDGALGWLHVGKVPLLVLLILFLFGFSLGGYVVQLFAHGAMNTYLPAWLAAVPALFIGISTVRAFGGLLARIIPKDETTAVQASSLIGRAGVVITGTARQGMAAEVRIRDQHGNAHYLMVEPDLPDDEFIQGTEVLIVKKAGAFYRGIRNPHPALM